MTPQNKLYWGIGVAITAVVLGWLYYESIKPLPGTKIDDLGRDHVAIGTEVVYNSNPPTSGPHYEVWTRSGVYSEVLDDRNLVHSLEHGYVIMSYNCDVANATASAIISESFNSDECRQVKDQLATMQQKKGGKKLIVIPRPSLDTKIALTAWSYLDKFNDYDENRIETFIGKHLNNGPERTME